MDIWPIPNLDLIKKITTPIIKSEIIRNELIADLTSVLSSSIGFPSILWPSARSGIAHILKHASFNRSNSVYINRFSSTCLYVALGSFTNVTTDYVRPDAEIVNHKFGKTVKSQTPQNKVDEILLIEDSCDSIILNSRDLFLNNERAAVISLPKIIGSVSGALIILNPKFENSNLINSFKLAAENNAQLGDFQFKAKIAGILNPRNFDSTNWYVNEHINSHMPINELVHIQDCLSNLDLNVATIRRRRKEIDNIFGFQSWSDDRLGPGFIYPLLAMQEKIVLDYGVPVYHVDLHRENGKDSKFVKCAIFPIHMGITNLQFEKELECMQTLKSQEME